MTNPTRDQILAAHRALAHLCNAASDGLFISEQAAHSIKDQVLDALPPVPRPTMAEVEWDNRKHFLAVVEVDHEKYKRAIMLKQDVPGDVIECFALHPNKRVVGYFSPDMLTLTGKRYILTEVQE
jgi:hypothetical protein